MQQKIDNLWLGIILGTILPILTFYAIYRYGFSGMTTFNLAELIAIPEYSTRVLSFGVIPNIAIFFLFIWTDKLKSARGVLTVTIIYAFAVFAIKIFV